MTEQVYDQGVFEALAEAIEGLEAPVGGDDLAGLIALGDRLDAAIAEAVGEFDRRGGWELEGDTSMTAWLRHRARMVNRDAARLSPPLGACARCR